MRAAALVTSVPVEPGRSEAARAARRELAKRVYHQDDPGLADRALHWLLTQLRDLLDHAAGASPGGYGGLVVVVLVLLALVVGWRLGVGPVRRTPSSAAPLFTSGTRSAADHRIAADAHAATGRYAEAVRDRLRAVVRELEERGVLDERAARTAHEAAAEAGLAVPSCATDLADAALLFDQVWYGARPATAEHYERLGRLDEAVRGARAVAR